MAEDADQEELRKRLFASLVRGMRDQLEREATPAQVLESERVYEDLLKRINARLS